MVCFRQVRERGHMAYDLDLSDGERSWRVQRRYKEILGCHQALSRNGGTPGGRSLPLFPAKEPVCQQLFGRESQRQMWAADRACQLHSYLDGLLDSEAAMQAAPVRRLLGVEGDADREDLSCSLGSALAGLRVRPLGSSGEIEVDVRVDAEQQQLHSGAEPLRVSLQFRRLDRGSILHQPASSSSCEAGDGEGELALEFVFPLGSSQATQRVAVGAGSAWRVRASSCQSGIWSEPVELIVRTPRIAARSITCCGEESSWLSSPWALHLRRLFVILLVAGLTFFESEVRRTVFDLVEQRQKLCWVVAAVCAALSFLPLVLERQKEPVGLGRHPVAEASRQDAVVSIPREIPTSDWRQVGPEEVVGLPVLEPVFRGFYALARAEELSVAQILETGEAFVQILQAMGPAMAPGRIDFAKNMRKTRLWYEGDRTGRANLTAFLEAEKATGIHRPGGVLKDPSGAVGTLWMRRTFEFVIAIFERILEGAAMSDAVRGGYEEALQRFHGRFLRGTFAMVIRGVPSREVVLRGLQVNEETVTRSVRALCLVSRPACAKMRAIAESLDLEDTRRV